MAINELSLIIPAYNEEKRIAPVLRDHLSFFRKKGIGFEIIVVSNNCSDSTPEIVAELAKENKEIIPLNFPCYTGKGGAVFEGFKKAGKSIVGFVDADESTSPEQFYKVFLEVANGFDVAIGSRALSGSTIEKKQPLHRLFAAKIFVVIVSLTFGLWMPDTQCGAKVFKKSVIDAVLPSLKSTGWEFDVELLWKIKKKGFSIKQVPIAWRDAEYSRFSLAATPKMFVALLKRRLGF